MFNLTRQQQNAVCLVAFLLITGWVVKACRTAHPPASPSTTPHLTAQPVDAAFPQPR